MAKTAVGYFDNLTDAEQAVQALVESGFLRNEINLVASDPTGQYAKTHSATKKEEETAEAGGSNLGVGAGAGAVVGGLGGLLVGLVIPGVGFIVAAGPLAAAFLGAGFGAPAGGIIGALVDIGVAEEEAGVYAEGIRRGGAVVSIRAEDLRVNQALDIFARYHAVDIEKRAAEWRQSDGATIPQPPRRSE